MLSKYSIRFLALLLVPCLVADPITASAFESPSLVPSTSKALLEPQYFDTQALELAVIAARKMLRTERPVGELYEEQLPFASKPAVTAKRTGTLSFDREFLEALSDLWMENADPVTAAERRHWADYIDAHLTAKGTGLTRTAVETFETAAEYVGRSGSESLNLGNDYTLEIYRVKGETDQYLLKGIPDRGMGPLQFYSRRLEVGQQGALRPTIRIYIPDGLTDEEVLAIGVHHDFIEQAAGSVHPQQRRSQRSHEISIVEPLDHWVTAVYEWEALKPVEFLGMQLPPRFAKELRTALASEDELYLKALASTEYLGSDAVERERRRTENPTAFQTAIANAAIVKAAAERALQELEKKKATQRVERILNSQEFSAVEHYPRRLVIGGNWKMNPGEESKAVELVRGVIDRLGKEPRAVEIVIAVPDIYVRAVREEIMKREGDEDIPRGTIQLAVQDASHLDRGASGAHTSQTSAEMYQSMGVKYVILGHSERRNDEFIQESSELVNLKAKRLTEAGMNVIVCVGETKAQREQGIAKTEEVLGEQIGKSLIGLGPRMGQVVVAYEPVWAINTGLTATNEDANQTQRFLRGKLGDMFGWRVASKTRIQYGGSMKPGNAAGLLQEPDVDGGLIGGAALDPDQFVAIITAATQEQTRSAEDRAHRSPGSGQHPPIKAVAVIGAGEMGAGIAYDLARAGYDVYLYDNQVEKVDVAAAYKKPKAYIVDSINKGIGRNKIKEPAEDVAGRITYAKTLEEAAEKADFIFEAVFEDVDVKRKVISDLRKLRPDIVIASNTSSLGLGKFAKGDRDVEIAHFFGPVPSNHSVEVAVQEGASPEVQSQTLEVLQRMDKWPVRVKDYPGSAFNHFFIPFANLAFRHADHGYSPATIDAALAQIFGPGARIFEGFVKLRPSWFAVQLDATELLLEQLGDPIYSLPSLLEKNRARIAERENLTEYAPGEDVNPDQFSEIQQRFLGLVRFQWRKILEQGLILEPNPARVIDDHTQAIFKWPDGPLGMSHTIGIAAAEESDRAFEAFMRGENIPLPSFPSGELNPRILEYAKHSTEGHVATLIINRPYKQNALNAHVAEALRQEFDEATDNTDVHAIVLRGEGKAFMSGADLQFFIQNATPDKLKYIKEFTRKGQALLRQIANSSVPFVAFINGVALGGGLELALAAPIRLAAPKAKIGFPETSIGLFPGLGGSARTVRLVGAALAKLLILTGPRLSAEDAYAIGMIDAPPSETARLLQRVQELASGPQLGPTEFRRQLLGERAVPHPEAVYSPELIAAFNHQTLEEISTALYALEGSSARADEAIKAFKRAEKKFPKALRKSNEYINQAVGTSMLDDERLDENLIDGLDIFLNSPTLGSLETMTGMKRGFPGLSDAPAMVPRSLAAWVFSFGRFFALNGLMRWSVTWLAPRMEKRFWKPLLQTLEKGELVTEEALATLRDRFVQRHDRVLDEHGNFVRRHETAQGLSPEAVFNAVAQTVIAQYNNVGGKAAHAAIIWAHAFANETWAQVIWKTPRPVSSPLAQFVEFSKAA